MAGIAQLKAMVGMDSSAYKAGARGVDQSTKGMSNKIASLGKAMAAAFSVAAITAGIRVINDFASTLSDAAMNLGLMTEEMMALNEVAIQNGMQTDQVGKMIGKLEKRLYDAITGDKLAVEAFDALGLSMADLVKMSPAEQFQAVAKAAIDSKMPVETLAELFGERLGPVAVQTLRQIAEDGLPAVDKGMADSIDKIKAWGSAWEGLKTQVKTILADIGVSLINVGKKIAAASSGYWEAAFAGKGVMGSMESASDAWGEKTAEMEKDAADSRKKREDQIAESTKAREDTYIANLQKQMAVLDEKTTKAEGKASKNIKAWAPSLSGLEKVGASFGGAGRAMQTMARDRELIIQEKIAEATKDMVLEMKTIQDKIDVIRGQI